MGFHNDSQSSDTSISGVQPDTSPFVDPSPTIVDPSSQTYIDPSGNTNSKNYRVVVNGGAAQSFTYDANGNMTSDGVRTYVWDAENRLIKIVEGAKRTEIEYDGFHHWTRILERNGATTVSDRRFIWDGNTLVEQRNGTSTTAAQRYLPQGVQQGTSKFFYTRDHLGSIREVVNNSGAVVARYDYDPYGRRTKLSGTFDSDFGFTGHYFHAPSGLHFAPFRAYNAEFGRWLSRDPIGEIGGINLYGYVVNDPVNAIDPYGLRDMPWPLNGRIHNNGPHTVRGYDYDNNKWYEVPPGEASPWADDIDFTKDCEAWYKNEYGADVTFDENGKPSGGRKLDPNNPEDKAIIDDLNKKEDEYEKDR